MSSLRFRASRFALRANLTHFLRIPIAAGKSYPQVKEAHHRLKSDPLFNVVPEGAFTHLDNLHLTIGELRLDTPKRVDAACQLLSKLEKDRWRQVFAASEKEVRSGTTSNLGTLTTRIAPFIVDLVGVGETLLVRRPKTDLSRMIRLYTRIREPTGLLERFCWGLNSIFRSEDLGTFDPILQHTGKPPMQIRLVYTGETVPSGVRNPRPDCSPDKKLLRRFDARTLNEKYEGVPWVESIQLEEIRISKMGRPRRKDGSLVQHAFNDVAIAALPGFCETTQTPNDIDDRV